MNPLSERVSVLIVGGGPVGLALAVELGWRGIPCALIEQTDGKISTPKMNEVNVRTMEFCRRWGVADAVFNCPFPADYPIDVVFVTTLPGHELGRIPRAPRASQSPEPHSPMHFQVCSQIWFDPILQAFARSLPSVKLHYRHRLCSFEVGQGGVRAEVLNRDSGERHGVEADYLVGCDGANSLVRRELGIGLEGSGTIGYPIHMFFRTPDLLEHCGRRPGTFFFAVDRDGVWGNARIIDPANGLWRLMVDRSDGQQRPEQVDRQGYLHRLLGHHLDVEWLETSIWHRRSVVAQGYGQDRVFLAGDAVHQLSPTGGLGMNSGIADSVDLGWKLAATLQGWGGAGLLASYDRERRPVGHRNVEMATRFYLNAEGFGAVGADLDEPGERGDELRRKLGERLVREVGPEFRTIGLQLGYRYEDSPICVDDGSPATPDKAATYEPTARPGSRAPHAWLQDGRSTLDLFGRGFVLMKFPGAPKTDAIERAARSRAVPLAVVAVGDADAAELYARSLVLVRPDGHVAWRGDVPPADPVGLIDRVRGAA